MAQIESKRVTVRVGLNMPDSKENENIESSPQAHVFELGKRAGEDQRSIIHGFLKIMIDRNEEPSLRLLSAVILASCFLILALFSLVVIYILASLLFSEINFMPIFVLFGLLCTAIIVSLPLFMNASKNQKIMIEESRMAQIADTKKLVTP